jgi:dynein heavy chain, axonemal
MQAEKQAKALFQVFVNFEQRSMSFSPSEMSILEELNSNTLEGITSLIQAAPRVLFMRAFAHLFDGKPNGLNLLAILKSMPRFSTLRTAINQAIIDDFSSARDAIKVCFVVLRCCLLRPQ